MINVQKKQGDLCMAVEVEAGFKILQNQYEAEKILLDNGFECTFKTITRDVYFGKDVNFEGKDETQIKRSLIRCRNFEKLENLKIFDPSLPDRIKVDLKTLSEYILKFYENGYQVVFDTIKTDWIYKKGQCWHQLQDIKHIGLVDYVYNEEIFGKGLGEQQQFDMLKAHIKQLGLQLEYEYGIDKLRSLYTQQLQFSTNQIGKYEYQEH